MVHTTNQKKYKKSPIPISKKELKALKNPYHFIMKLTHDTCWKFVTQHNMNLLAPFFLDGIISQLDFNNMEYLNKELQNIMMENADDRKGYVDKLVKIFKIRWPNKYILLHLEFQTVANKKFSSRTGFYKIGLRLNNRDCTIITITIIHRATKFYKHGQHQFGSKTNGETIHYQGYIIKDMQESDFADTTCLANLLFHSVWLYEHRREFSKDVLVEKYTAITKNLIALGLVGKAHYSNMLFIFNNAQKSLSNSRKFQNFVREITLIDKKNNPMTVIEQYIQYTNEESREEGRVEGREEGMLKKSMEIAKKLLKSGNTLKHIAELTGLEINRLKKLKSSL